MLDESIRPFEGVPEVNDNQLEQSMAEADSLLNMFRESFSSLNQALAVEGSNVSRSQTRSGTFIQSLSNSLDDADSVGSILEKYSDKLLDMITRKLGNKVDVDR